MSSSPGLASGSAMCVERPIRLPKTQNGPSSDRRTVPLRDEGGCLRADLEHEQERDQERVDHQRLDQGEAEDHRREDLSLRAGVARDAFEGRAGRAALADAAAECGETDA